jgi:hypothetical protein
MQSPGLSLVGRTWTVLEGGQPLSNLTQFELAGGRQAVTDPVGVGARFNPGFQQAAKYQGLEGAVDLGRGQVESTGEVRESKRAMFHLVEDLQEAWVGAQDESVGGDVSETSASHVWILVTQV